MENAIARADTGGQAASGTRVRSIPFPGRSIKDLKVLLGSSESPPKNRLTSLVDASPLPAARREPRPPHRAGCHGRPASWLCQVRPCPEPLCRQRHWQASCQWHPAPLLGPTGGRIPILRCLWEGIRAHGGARRDSRTSGREGIRAEGGARTDSRTSGRYICGTSVPPVGSADTGVGRYAFDSATDFAFGVCESRYSWMEAAASLPSPMARITVAAPRMMSPPAYTPGMLVAHFSSASM